MYEEGEVRPTPPILGKLQTTVEAWVRNLLRNWATVYDAVTDRVNGSLRWSLTTGSTTHRWDGEAVVGVGTDAAEISVSV